MTRRVFFSLLLMLSNCVYAEAIRSVHIWHDTENAPVFDDYRFPSYIQVEVFDLASMRIAENELNQYLIDSNVTFGDDINSNVAIAMDALEDYRQSIDFEEHVYRVQEVGVGLIKANQYDIKKAPTILINETYAIIGEASIADAIDIFKAKVR